MSYRCIACFTGLMLLAACAAGCVDDPNHPSFSTLTHDDTQSTEPTDNPLKISLNGNLWDSIRNSVQLDPGGDKPAVQKQIHWLQRHPEYIKKVVTQAAPYIYYIYEQTQKQDLPAELALIPIIESEYDPFVYSHVGAVGLWQIMPGTASSFGLKINWWYDGRRDLQASTNVAFRYLTYLHSFFDNDWLLAIAAYDSGEGNVLHAIRENKKADKDTHFWSLNLPKETKGYIPKLLAWSTIIQNPESYDIHLPPINDAPYLTVVNVHSQLNLKQAAKLAGMHPFTLRKLNPGFRRWASAPNGPHMLFLPIDKAAHFKRALETLPQKKRGVWQRYRVKNGDTLFTIAHHFKTKSSILKRVNHLTDETIHPKQNMLIPKSFTGLPSRLRFGTQQIEKITEDTLPGPHRSVYTVKKGDTLSQISKRFGVSAEQLTAWNALSHAKINPGNQILMWRKRKKQVLPIFVYHVKKGDSLIKLAQQFNTTPQHIRQLNNIKGNRIRLAQTLQIQKGTSPRVRQARH